MLVARGCRKIALVYPQDSPGEDLVDPLALGLEAAGGRLVYRHAYPRPDPDFRQPVNELKGIDADLVVVAGLELQAGTFLRTAREFGLATPVLGGLDDSPGGRARSGQTRDGTLHLAPYDVASGTPENQAFVRRFRARHHRQPDAWAAQGYDALHLLARACRSTGSRNPLDLSYAIRSMPPWEGANGLYLFDGHGALRDKPLAIPGLAPKAPEPGELSPAGTHLPENR